MSKKLFTIIIPTWNNSEFLLPCIRSLENVNLLFSHGEIIIVNNGSDDYERYYKRYPFVRVLTPGKNLGWEGGLKLGMESSDSEFVVFLNDDTHLPPSGFMFFSNLLQSFKNPEVALVAPITTTAAGLQSIYHPQCPAILQEVSWTIFFCAMLRRSAVETVGGIDTDLPGGDDLDLSMRLRKAGFKLLVNPAAFIIHHGFKTGTRVNGGPERSGGWNSPEMTDATNRALIQKHGFRFFFETMANQAIFYGKDGTVDREGNAIRSMVNGQSAILELGCGAQKTTERAIGVDMIPKGEPIATLHGRLSVADVTANVAEILPFPDDSQDLIIARHVLEHCLDTVATLLEWKRVLKPGGKLIIAVPNEDFAPSIPMNPEHVHAFTPDTLARIGKLTGFEVIRTVNPENGVSFIAEFMKSNTFKCGWE